MDLGDFELDDTAWDALDGDFLQDLLQDGQRADASSESPKGDAISSDADRSRSHGSTDRSQQKPGSRAKRGRTEDSAEEKLEKLRNRNRMAQARRRQRQKEELEALERRIAETKQKIQSAQIRSRTIREQKVATSQRLVQADNAMHSIQNTPQIPQVAAPVPVYTLPAPPLCIPSAYVSPQNYPQGSLIAVKPTFNGGEHILQSRKSRPIEAFRAHCPLFVESCLASMSDSSMNKPSFSNILHSHKTASLMGQGSVPISDICWFVQSIYSTPDGIPMSINSSLSTVRCTVTLLHAFMLAQLECAMIDKELDCLNGLMTEESASSNSRFSYSVRGGNDSPITSMYNDGGCSLVSCPLINLSQWAQGVTLSCGVNDSVDMCTAVTHTMTTVLRSYRPHLPRAVWLHCCQEFLLKLDIMVGRKRSDGGVVPQTAWKTAVRASEQAKTAAYSVGTAKARELVSSDLAASISDSGVLTGESQNSLEGSDNIFEPEDPMKPQGELQFAHKVDEKRANDPDVTCTTDAPKFEGIYMRVALLVQIMAESVHNCMLESGPLEQHNWQPCENRRRDVMERADLVDSSWRYIYSTVMNDAPYVARDCSVDICGPGLSSLEWMEETHAQLYKRLHLSHENRSRMVSLWREWQRHRRSLDTELETACGRLSAVANVEEISDCFVAFISSQCSSAGGGVGGVPSQLADRACRFQPRNLLGLCPTTTHAAHAALLALQEVQDRDARLQVDFMATHIRPSTWSRAQGTKAVASMVSHNVKFDHFMIWQIASLRARRYDLFVSRAFAQDVVPV